MSLQATNKRTRRSKKRRTADISDSDSDSSSSSSSSSASESEKEADAKENEDNIELSDIEMSEQDEAQKVTPERLDDETKDRLNQIPLTNTELSKRAGNNVNSIDLKKVQHDIEEAKEKVSLVKDGNELKNAYLNVLFNHYGEDVNSLREAPDFTAKSLVLLANVLKDGANMFDVDSLKTIVEPKQ